MMHPTALLDQHLSSFLPDNFQLKQDDPRALESLLGLSAESVHPENGSNAATVDRLVDSLPQSLVEARGGVSGGLPPPPPPPPPPQQVAISSASPQPAQTPILLTASHVLDGQQGLTFTVAPHGVHQHHLMSSGGAVASSGGHTAPAGTQFVAFPSPLSFAPAGFVAIGGGGPAGGGTGGSPATPVAPSSPSPVQSPYHLQTHSPLAQHASSLPRSSPAPPPLTPSPSPSPSSSSAIPSVGQAVGSASVSVPVSAPTTLHHLRPNTPIQVQLPASAFPLLQILQQSGAAGGTVTGAQFRANTGAAPPQQHIHPQPPPPPPRPKQPQLLPKPASGAPPPSVSNPSIAVSTNSTCIASPTVQSVVSTMASSGPGAVGPHGAQLVIGQNQHHHHHHHHSPAGTLVLNQMIPGLSQSPVIIQQPGGSVQFILRQQQQQQQIVSGPTAGGGAGGVLTNPGVVGGPKGVSGGLVLAGAQGQVLIHHPQHQHQLQQQTQGRQLGGTAGAGMAVQAGATGGQVVRFITTTQGPMQLQQIQTPSGPTLIAVPPGQTLSFQQIRGAATGTGSVVPSAMLQGHAQIIQGATVGPTAQTLQGHILHPQQQQPLVHSGLANQVRAAGPAGAMLPNHSAVNVMDSVGMMQRTRTMGANINPISVISPPPSLPFPPPQSRKKPKKKKKRKGSRDDEEDGEGSTGGEVDESGEEICGTVPMKTLNLADIMKSAGIGDDEDLGPYESGGVDTADNGSLVQSPHTVATSQSSVIHQNCGVSGSVSQEICTSSGLQHQTLITSEAVNSHSGLNAGTNHQQSPSVHPSAQQSPMLTHLQGPLAVQQGQGQMRFALSEDGRVLLQRDCSAAMQPLSPPTQPSIVNSGAPIQTSQSSTILLHQQSVAAPRAHLTPPVPQPVSQLLSTSANTPSGNIIGGGVGGGSGSGGSPSTGSPAPNNHVVLSQLLSHNGCGTNITSDTSLPTLPVGTQLGGGMSINQNLRNMPNCGHQPSPQMSHQENQLNSPLQLPSSPPFQKTIPQAVPQPVQQVHQPPPPSPVSHHQQPSPIPQHQQPSPLPQHQQPSPISQHQQTSPAPQLQQPSPAPLPQQPSPAPPHHQQSSPAPPHHQQPSPAPPHHQQPSPAPPHHQQPSPAPSHHQQPSPAPPHNQQPSPAPPHHRQPSPAPPHHRQPSPAPPHHQQPSPAPTHHQQPSPSPLHHQQQPSPAPPLIQQASPAPPHHQQSSPAPVYQQQPSPIPMHHHQQPSPVPMHHQQASPAPLHHQQASPAPLHHQQASPSPLHHQQASPAPIHHQQPSPAVEQQPLPQTSQQQCQASSPPPPSSSPDHHNHQSNNTVTIGGLVLTEQQQALLHQIKMSDLVAAGAASGLGAKSLTEALIQALSAVASNISLGGSPTSSPSDANAQQKGNSKFNKGKSPPGPPTSTQLLLQQLGAAVAAAARKVIPAGAVIEPGLSQDIRRPSPPVARKRRKKAEITTPTLMNSPRLQGCGTLQNDVARAAARLCHPPNLPRTNMPLGAQSTSVNSFSCPIPSAMTESRLSSPIVPAPPFITDTQMSHLNSCDPVTSSSQESRLNQMTSVPMCQQSPPHLVPISSSASSSPSTTSLPTTTTSSTQADPKVLPVTSSSSSPSGMVVGGQSGIIQRVQTIQLTAQKQQQLREVQQQLQALTSRKGPRSAQDNLAIQHLYLQQQRILLTGKIVPTIPGQHAQGVQFSPMSPSSSSTDHSSTSLIAGSVGNSCGGKRLKAGSSHTTCLANLPRQPVSSSSSQSPTIRYYHQVGNQIIPLAPQQAVTSTANQQHAGGVSKGTSCEARPNKSNVGPTGSIPSPEPPSPSTTVHSPSVTPATPIINDSTPVTTCQSGPNSPISTNSVVGGSINVQGPQRELYVCIGGNSLSAEDEGESSSVESALNKQIQGGTTVITEEQSMGSSPCSTSPSKTPMSSSVSQISVSPPQISSCKTSTSTVTCGVQVSNTQGNRTCNEASQPVSEEMATQPMDSSTDAESPRGAVKRPALSPVRPTINKVSLIEQQLRTDQAGALNPDVHSPFTDRADACKRLVRYHVLNERVLSARDLDKADEIFEATARHLLDKFSQMTAKYRYLLLMESMKEVRTSELMMIDRMFVAEEQLALERLKEEARLAEELEKKKEEKAKSDDDDEEDGVTKKENLSSNAAAMNLNSNTSGEPGLKEVRINLHDVLKSESIKKEAEEGRYTIVRNSAVPIVKEEDERVKGEAEEEKPYDEWEAIQKELSVYCGVKREEGSRDMDHPPNGEPGARRMPGASGEESSCDASRSPGLGGPAPPLDDPGGGNVGENSNLCEDDDINAQVQSAIDSILNLQRAEDEGLGLEDVFDVTLEEEEDGGERRTVERSESDHHDSASREMVCEVEEEVGLENAEESVVSTLSKEVGGGDLALDEAVRSILSS